MYMVGVPCHASLWHIVIMRIRNGDENRRENSKNNNKARM